MTTMQDRATGPSAVACGLAAFVSAAGALALEIAAARAVAPFTGSSLHIWTAIIAAVVSGFALGHWLGGRLADAPTAVAARRLTATFIVASLFCLLCLSLLALLSGGLRLPRGAPVPGSLAVAFGLFLLPTAAAGAVSPILAKLAVDADPQRTGRTLGRMFALGTAGAVAGAAATGFALLDLLGAVGSIATVAALFAVLAAWAARVAGITRHAAAAGAATLASAAVLSAWIGAFRSPCAAESAYFCIRFTDESLFAEGRTMRGIVLDHDHHSSNVRDDPTYLYWSYAQFFDSILAARAPKGPRVFYLGGGGYTLPRALLVRDPGAKVTVGELDAAVTRAAMEQLWVTPSPRMTIVHGDGRLTLQALPPEERFDVVINDAYKSLQVPPHLTTREFVREAKARLAPRGTYLANMIDARQAPRLMPAVVKTLREIHPSVEVWFEEGQEGYSAYISYLIVAGEAASDFDVLDTRHGRPYRFLRMAQADLDAIVNAPGVQVLTDDYAPVDRLASLYCSLRFLERVGIDIGPKERCT